MRRVWGGGGNYTVPYTAFCWTYIVILYSYMLSPYIRTKHNVDYALAYSVTAYTVYAVILYQRITIYGRRSATRRLLGVFLISLHCDTFIRQSGRLLLLAKVNGLDFHLICGAFLAIARRRPLFLLVNLATKCRLSGNGVFPIVIV